jgi:hypothetical protein
MTMLVVGELRDVAERVAGREPNTWTEHVAYVLAGRVVTQVVIAQGQSFTFRGDVPSSEDVGTVVALEVGVRAYTTKDGGARYSLTAFGRSAEVESALSVSADAGIRVAS